MRWLRRGSAMAILLIGWVFIAWQNHFHVTAPMVFVCLGYLAVVATVYNLWRTGTAAVDSSEDMADSTWAKPTGALGELEREKRTLLKAIKEAEFDHQMGKLSQRDADEMIHGYRARAIEVIKRIDQLGLGAASSVREQILREVRARIQLDGKSPRKAGAKVKPVTHPITAERRWQCPKCAAALEKAGLGIVMIPGESAEALKGNVTCSKCGASFTQASIYGGTFDVRSDAKGKAEAGNGMPAEAPAAEAAP
ncbi:MAG TPA: hypothetical protein VF469_15135, partial [Kofleriaceae bacterium]